MKLLFNEVTKKNQKSEEITLMFCTLVMMGNSQLQEHGDRKIIDFIGKKQVY